MEEAAVKPQMRSDERNDSQHQRKMSLAKIGKVAWPAVAQHQAKQELQKEETKSNRRQPQSVEGAVGYVTRFHGNPGMP